MLTETMRIPVFPLPVFLLPGGMTRLNIFEPRYLKMVKVASQGEGFVIQTTGTGGPLSEFGSWVQITNFGQSQNGLLQIDVLCKGLVLLSQAARDPDQLLWAQASPVAHWPAELTGSASPLFAASLQQCLQQNEQLSSLYSSPLFEQESWVVARWLEIAPIANSYKVLFYLPDSYPKAVALLSEILLNKTEAQ